ncbi:POU domain protein [Fasciola hepatica]|uniref:POU domain protein n=1 Tax=Fasciola hepatica TaxID=6192 RepID=A0A4E0S198_FASHE|nr:POU domain protein [Fasciola hepatica]
MVLETNQSPSKFAVTYCQLSAGFQKDSDLHENSKFKEKCMNDTLLSTERSVNFLNCQVANMEGLRNADQKGPRASTYDISYSGPVMTVMNVNRVDQPMPMNGRFLGDGTGSSVRNYASVDSDPYSAISMLDCVKMTNQHALHSRVSTIAYSDQPAAGTPWNLESYSSNRGPKSSPEVTVMGTNLCELVYNDSGNPQTSLNLTTAFGGGIHDYSTENASTCDEYGRLYRLESALCEDQCRISTSRLNSDYTQKTHNRKACFANTSDLTPKACPNITILPWCWRDSNVQLPSLSYTRRVALSDGYLGNQSQLLEMEEDGEEQEKMRMEEKVESMEASYPPTEQNAYRQLCPLPWPTNGTDYSKITNTVVEGTNTQSMRNSSPTMIGDVCKDYESSFCQPSQCTYSTNFHHLKYPIENQPKCSSPSAYSNQLNFSSHETWYHSLGLLSAFTQILAPSHCNHSSRFERDTTVDAAEHENICPTSEDQFRDDFSPLSQIKVKSHHHSFVSPSGGSSTWAGSLDMNHSVHPYRLDDKQDDDQSGSDLGVPLCTDLFGNLPDSTLEELRHFACMFKQRRMKLGVTQAEVGRALGRMQLGQFGCLSQSTICRFESLTLSHNNMLVLKPILEKWLEQMEMCASSSPGYTELGDPFDAINQSDGVLESERRRRRTSITEPEKRMLEAYFQVEPKPTSEELGRIANGIRLRKSVVRVWFCNQRQKQKRMQMKQHLSRGAQFHPSPITDTNMHCCGE